MGVQRTEEFLKYTKKDLDFFCVKVRGGNQV